MFNKMRITNTISINSSNSSLSKIKTVTNMFVNGELTVRQLKSKLNVIDIDASNLLDTFWYEEFTEQGFIKAYKSMVLDRILTQ